MVAGVLILVEAALGGSFVTAVGVADDASPFTDEAAAGTAWRDGAFEVPAGVELPLGTGELALEVEFSACAARSRSRRFNRI